jgi:hypothetical protein
MDWHRPSPSFAARGSSVWRDVRLTLDVGAEAHTAGCSVVLRPVQGRTAGRRDFKTATAAESKPLRPSPPRESRACRAHSVDLCAVPRYRHKDKPAAAALALSSRPALSLTAPPRHTNLRRDSKGGAIRSSADHVRPHARLSRRAKLGTLGRRIASAAQRQARRDFRNVPTAVFSRSTLDPRQAIESAQRATASVDSATVCRAPRRRCNAPARHKIRITLTTRARRTLVHGEAFQVL